MLSFSVSVYPPSVCQRIRSMLYLVVLQKTIEYLDFPGLDKQGLDYCKVLLKILSSGSLLFLISLIPDFNGRLSIEY